MIEAKKINGLWTAYNVKEQKALYFGQYKTKKECDIAIKHYTRKVNK